MYRSALDIATVSLRLCVQQARKRNIVFWYILALSLGTYWLAAFTWQPASGAFVTQVNHEGIAPTVIQDAAPPDETRSVYIIRLRDAPLATYRRNLAAAAGAHAPPHLADQTSREYLDHLAARQAAFSVRVQQMAAAAQVLYTYQVAYNGLAVALTPAEAARIAELPEVVALQADQWYYPAMDRSPDFLGMPTVWNQLGGQETAGQGVIIGIIDTGIWPEHPSFQQPDSFPSPPAKWQGDCVQPADGSPDYACHNKLIGLQYFLDGYVNAVGGTYDGLFHSGRDEDGHGTGVASVAAGNANVQATLFGQTRGQISGIAPGAHLAVYKAIGRRGAMTSDLVAAIDKAVADGVDVLNLSFSGPPLDPWTNPVTLSALAAHEAGIFVVAAAGPNQSAVGAPANAPWVTAVGAATTDRQFASTVTVNGAAEAAEVAFTFTGASVLGAGINNFKLVAAAGIADNTGDTSGLCLNPFNPNTFDANTVVVCPFNPLLNILRTSHAVRGGGAAGLLLYNTQPHQTLTSANHAIPAVHVDYDAGVRIQQLLDAASQETQLETDFSSAGVTEGTSLQIGFSSASVTQLYLGDTMASMSGRGAGAFNILKPDLTAPGVQILSANTPQNSTGGAMGQLFQTITGTSMSAPHVAGIAALLKHNNPNLSPDQLRSILMMTSTPTVLDSDGLNPADPFDTGTGRLNPHVALNANQALDSNSPQAYQTANPSEGGDPRTLNMPYLIGEEAPYQWERTLINTSPTTATTTYSITHPPLPQGSLTVTPQSFQIPAGDTFNFSVNVTFTGLQGMTPAQANQWVFGALVLSGEDDVDFRVPLAVRMPQSAGEQIFLPALSNRP